MTNGSASAARIFCRSSTKLARENAASERHSTSSLEVRLGGSLLVRSELRDIRRNPLNALFVTLSLSVGVLSVMATHQLSVFILDRFATNNAAGAFDYVVYLPSRTEHEYFELRDRWRSGELPNVTHMVPIVEGMITIGGSAYDVLGYDPVATMPTSVSSVRGMQADPRFMTDYSVVAVGGELREGDHVNGAVVISRADGLRQQLLADLPSAQQLLDRAGEIDAVWLRTERSQSIWWDRVVPGLGSAIGTTRADFNLTGYRVLPFTWWNPSQQLGDAIVFNLGMLSLLTLLVAGFIVFQAVQSNLRNREQQAELLEIMGFNQATQRILAILQCTIFGVTGCVFGTLAGIALLGFVSESSWSATWREIDVVGVWKAIGLGMATALAVGLLAKRDARTHARIGGWILAGLALIGIAYGLHEDSGLLGASLLSVCFCVLSVFLVTPLALRAVVAGLRKLPTKSFTWRLDLRNAVATVNDIRLAINALAIAVATAVGIGLMLMSFRGEFSNLLEQRLASDLHLSNASDFLAAEFALREDVVAVRSYHRGDVRVNGTPIQATATRLDPVERSRYGYSGDAIPGIFLNEIAAKRYELRVGDSVMLDIATNPSMPIPILHVFKDYGESSSRIVVSQELVNLENLIADRFSLDVLDVEAVRLAIAQAYPGIQVLDSAEIRTQAIAVFDASFATAQIMVNVAIFVAVVGMACALFGLQAKRLLEMRLLTMMGLSRAKLVLHAIAQNAFIGLFAVIVALPLSFAIAWNLCYHVNPRAYGWAFDLAFAWEPILLPTTLGVVAAVLAGLEPMRRALAKAVSTPLSHAS